MYEEDTLLDVSELELAARGRYPWRPVDLAARLYDFDKTAVSRKFGAAGYRFTIETDGRAPLYATADGLLAMCQIAAYAHPIPATPETWGKIIMYVLPDSIDVKIYYDAGGVGADGLLAYISELVLYLAENDFEPDTAVLAQVTGDEDTAVYVPTRPENFRQWQAVWRLIRRKVERGETTAKIATWLQWQENLTDLPASYKTVSKIITAGNAGKLETKPSKTFPNAP